MLCPRFYVRFPIFAEALHLNSQGLKQNNIRLHLLLLLIDKAEA